MKEEINEVHLAPNPVIAVSELFVDGQQFEGMMLCPGCRKRLVLEGCCTPCAELFAYVESKRLREANVEREFQEAVKRVQTGVVPFESAPFEALDSSPDMSNRAMVAVLGGVAVVAGLILVGGWTVGRWLISWLLVVSR